MPFLGKNPTSGFSTIVKDDLTPDGSTTAFTLSKQVASANDIAVFVGNVRQEPTDAYSVSGTTLTMTAAPASGINFYVLHIAGTLESSVVPAAGTSVPGAFGVSGNLDVDGTLNVSDDLKFIGGATPQLGIGTLTPNRKFVVYGNNASGAEISLTNTDMTADKRTLNFYMSGDKANMRVLNDAGTAGTNAIEFTSEGYVTKPNHPMSSAGSGTTPSAATQEVTNMSVIVNNGNHYNASNGRFTCPVAGIYEVNAHMLSAYAAAYNWIAIFKNGSPFQNMHWNPDSASGHHYTGLSLLVTCAVNDTLSGGIQNVNGVATATAANFYLTVKLIG